MFGRAILLAIVLASTVESAIAKEAPQAARSTLPAPTLTAETWVLMDFNSGWILAEKNSDQRIEPASLSKLMTAYVVFNELKKGTLTLDTPVHISKKAWRTEGSRMFVEVNTQVKVEDLLQGLIIQSGNDAAVALAEHVAGTEEAFAARMTEYAQRLGLTNTHFTNAAGLPDPDHYSAARDLTVLAAAIIREFPEYYKWYSTKEYTYNGITQRNRNLLLWRDPSVDGVKTGHTSGAGYCLVASAKRDGMRLLATVTGTSGPRQRAKEIQALLQYGFSNYESKKLFDANDPAAQVKVYKGDRDRVPVGTREPVFVTIPRGGGDALNAALTIPDSAIAPIGEGDELGRVDVTLSGEVVMEVPLVALEGVPEGSWWQRAIDTVLLWFD